MKFKTKRERLLAVIEKWRSLHGNRPFTTNEVAEWAQARGLYPVPERGCIEQEASEWEAKLEGAQA